MPVIKGLEWTFDTVASTYENLLQNKILHHPIPNLSMLFAAPALCAFQTLRLQYTDIPHLAIGVKFSNEDGTQPFAGYKQILNVIYNKVLTSKSYTVLDIAAEVYRMQSLYGNS